MEPAALDFLKRILETPSPSGYESQLQQLVRDHMEGSVDEVKTDVHGNLIAAKNTRASKRLMLAGHCDQIGLIVQHIDDNGFIYLQEIGGWDPPILLGQRMIVWTEQGPLLGVIGKKPIHLLNEEDRKKIPKVKELWLDIGASNRTQAESQVRVGDPVTVELGFHLMQNSLAVSPAMDDKSGLWVVMEAIRRMDASKLRYAVYAVSTVQEEVGLRGARTSAFGIDPQVGIAVDVTFATDHPTMEKTAEGDVRLGKGPVIYRGPNMNPKVVQQLVQAATEHQIPFQLGAAGRPPGTDANAIQVNRAGVATGLISVPNRYMHSPVEMISLDDIDRAADLLARFAENLSPEFDWVP